MRPPVENGKFIDNNRKYCGCVAKEGVVTEGHRIQLIIPPEVMSLKSRLEISSFDS